jgi:predicted SAM-dependent methyltransferase
MIQITGVLKTKLKLRTLLQSNLPLKLEIGSGPVKGKAGWVTMDLSNQSDLCWDLRWPFPFPDNSVAMLYSSHVFEHLTYTEIMRLLKECRRVLQPGGSFSICVPDASIYVRAYCQPDTFDRETFLCYKPALYSDQRMDILNYMFYMDGHHKYMFDQESLIAMLVRADFADAHARQFDPSIDMAARKHETIYAVAIK